MKTKLEKIQEEIATLGLTKKPVRNILEYYPYLYHRIYNYARRENIWLPKMFNELGLTLGRIDNLDSIQKLDVFMEEISDYVNKDWSHISPAHKILIKKTISSIGIQFNAFLLRYNISNLETRKYQTIDDIKRDLASKGLINPTIISIHSFDGGSTMANIESFAKKNRMKMRDIWFALKISYGEGIITYEAGVKKDFVYHNDDEMREDFISKGLIGKTKRDVRNYDNGKTVGRVNGYAKRSGIAISQLWDQLKIRRSSKEKIEMEFSTLDELKTIVKKRGLTGKSTSDLASIDPNLWAQVKKWARKGYSMSVIWEYIGIVRSQGFPDVDTIVKHINAAGYKTAKAVRSDWRFYKRISGFISRNNICISEVWEKAGISYANEGRPPKKRTQ